jgi:hypothetical protein
MCCNILKSFFLKPVGTYFSQFLHCWLGLTAVRLLEKLVKMSLTLYETGGNQHCSSLCWRSGQWSRTQRIRVARWELIQLRTGSSGNGHHKGHGIWSDERLSAHQDSASLNYYFRQWKVLQLVLCKCRDVDGRTMLRWTWKK